MLCVQCAQGATGRGCETDCAPSAKTMQSTVHTLNCTTQAVLGLQVLHMSRCNLGKRSAAALGRVLSKDGPLKEIDLSWNRLGNSGAKALAEGVQLSPKVCVCCKAEVQGSC